MAGIKGYRPSLHTKKLHHRRLMRFSMTEWPSHWWNAVRKRDCPDNLDAIPDYVIPYTEEWFLMKGCPEEF